MQFQLCFWLLGNFLPLVDPHIFLDNQVHNFIIQNVLLTNATDINLFMI